MGTWDVRLLSASYCQDGDDIAVELFGKTRDKKSITILYYGFNPYFFVVDPKENLGPMMRRDKDVVSIAEDRLLYKGEMHDVLKVTIKNPWQISEYRNKLKREYRLLAADIAFHYRFIYDMDMGSCIRVSGEEIEKEYATDLVVKMESFENIDSFDPGLKFLAFDIENSVLHDFIFTICSVVWENGEMRACEPVRSMSCRSSRTLARLCSMNF